ncbi:MAG: hypothetical protein U0821_16215 [Chloroflexota bacterium]
MRPLLLSLLLTLATLASTLAAHAQEIQVERRFVYGLNLFNGTEYVTGFVPPSIDTIYVLADHDTVLDPKVTEVYFWPITNDYRANFAGVAELVPGTLEIAQAGRIVSTAALTDYVVQFDREAGNEPGRVTLGSEAAVRWQEFTNRRAAYLAALHRYNEDQTAFTEKLSAARAANTALPEPPVEPAPFTLFSTEPNQGFAVHLPAGEYQIRLRDASGAPVADSLKRLISFAPRRDGVGYDVLPQDRWTVPETSDEPSEIIYAIPGAVLYLQPHAASELNALAHARLQNPQDLAPSPNRWRWVHTSPLADVTLSAGSSPPEPVREFAVEQTPGAALGYRVIPLAEARQKQPNKRPDITAFQVVTPSTPGSSPLRLKTSSGADLPSAARELVTVAPIAAWQHALPTLVPLAVGATVVLWRRQRVQRTRDLPAEQRSLLS